jgi:hypothetical protein
VIEEVDRPAGVVPNYLPGQNPFLTEFGEKYKIPQEAAGGGAASMHPELAKKILKAANASAAGATAATKK